MAFHIEIVWQSPEKKDNLQLDFELISTASTFSFMNGTSESFSVET